MTVAARTPFASIEAATPSGVIRATPRVITDPRQAKPVDWILVTTKAYDSDAAAQWFAKATKAIYTLCFELSLRYDLLIAPTLCSQAEIENPLVQATPFHRAIQAEGLPV